MYTYEILNANPLNNKFMVRYKKTDCPDFTTPVSVGNSLDIEEVKKAILRDSKAAIVFWDTVDTVENSQISQSLIGITSEFLASSEEPSLNLELEDLVATVTTSDSGVEQLVYSTSEKVVSDKVHNTKEKAAFDRYHKEVVGITWTDSQGNSFIFTTDAVSQGKFAAARIAADNGVRSDTSVWKCVDASGNVVFRPTTNAELIEICNLVCAHVQKCYDAEASVAQKAIVEDFTTDVNTEYSNL